MAQKPALTEICSVFQSDSLGLPMELCLPREYRLSVYLDGVQVDRATCSQDHLKEMVLGRLASGGLICEMEDILEYGFEPSGDFGGTVWVRRKKPRETEIRPIRTGSAVWTREWIDRLFLTLKKGPELYQKTVSTHSCILMRAGEILCTMEDIGRHNAFDKVVGWAMLHQIPMEECIVFSSGRIPVDTVCKAVRVGLTVLASKALPTAQALEMARKHQLTLLHRSERHGLLQFY